MIRQVAHLCIHSGDLAATERYWCGALGLQKGFEFFRQGRRFGFYLEAGGRTFIEVFEGKPTEVEGAIRHVCLEVDSVDAVATALRAHGYAATEKKLGCDKSWQIWSTDPHGVRIEFHEYTAESAQLHGGRVEADW